MAVQVSLIYSQVVNHISRKYNNVFNNVFSSRATILIVIWIDHKSCSVSDCILGMYRYLQGPPLPACVGQLSVFLSLSEYHQFANWLICGAKYNSGTPQFVNWLMYVYMYVYIQISWIFLHSQYIFSTDLVFHITFFWKMRQLNILPNKTTLKVTPYLHCNFGILISGKTRWNAQAKLPSQRV